MKEHIRQFFVFRHLLDRHLLAKSLFFSLYSSAVTGLLVFLFTNSTGFSTGAFVLDLIVRFGMYFSFEKNWELIHQKV